LLDRLDNEGVVNIKKLKSSAAFPSEKRLEQGPVAIIECLEEIPCDPCQLACPEKAIEIGEPLTNLPKFYEKKCTGCGLCVPSCPGLAIFVVDITYSDGEAIIQLPYEFLPLPQEGDEVDALDRVGEVIAKSKVKKVRSGAKFNNTHIISLVVPKDLAMEVRGIGFDRENEQQTGIKKINKNKKMPNTESGFSIAKSDEEKILPVVCRCEEIEESDIRKSITGGSTSIRELKNRERALMGFCQGKVCGQLLSRMISDTTGLQPDNILPANIRPPVRPVSLGELAKGRDDE